MGKIKKILVTVLLGGCLMLLPSQRASAQGMPTIDFSAILTNIMQYMQDYLMEHGTEMLENGGEAVSKLQSAIASYEELKDKLQAIRDIVAVVQSVSEVGGTILELIDIGDDISRRISNMNLMADYIRKFGYQDGMYALTIVGDMSAITYDAIESFTPIAKKLFSSSTYKRAEATDWVSVIRSTIQDFARQLYTTVRRYEGVMYSCYSRAKSKEYASRMGKDANMRIY